MDLFDNEKNGGGGDTTAVPSPADSLQQDIGRVLDLDPTLLDDVNAAVAGTEDDPKRPKPAPNPNAGKVPSLWRKVLDYINPMGENGIVPVAKRAEDAVTRGVLKGVDQLSDLVVRGGVEASKATGAYKVGRSDEEQRAFLDWWDQDTNKANPIRFGDERIARWYGPSAGGLSGFVEGAAQFATGMVTAGNYVKGFGAVKALGGVGAGMVAGAAADFSAFDPHMKRLSNLIEEDAPPAFRNAVTQYLAAKDDDGEAEGRLKMMLEGAVLGGTMESILGGVRGLKAWMKGDKAGAAKQIMDAAEAAQKPHPDEVVSIHETPDGEFAVVPTHEVKAGEPVKASEPAKAGETSAPVTIPPDAPTYSSRSEAENVAVTVNTAAKNERLTSGSFDAEGLANVRKAMQGYAEGKDPRDVAQLLDTYGVNVKYVQTPEEAINLVKSMVDVMPDPSTASRARPRTWAEVAKDADGVFKGMSGDDVVAASARIFGSTDKLDAHIFAMRAWLWKHAEMTRKLSALADAHPENALAQDELARAMDTMLDFHANLTGTNANTARGLAINRKPVGEALEEAAKETGGAKPTDAEVRGTAEVMGGEVDESALKQGEGKKPAGKKPSVEPGHRAPRGRKATEGLTKPEVRALARAVYLTDGDPAAMLAVLRGPKMKPPAEIANNPAAVKKWYDYVISYRMEAMLSGPKTLIINAVSNAIAFAQRPAEYWWGGLRTGNPALRQMGGDMYGGLWENSRESWSAARKAFSLGENVLDPQNNHTGQTLAGWGEASWLQRIAHAASRFLMGTDEFFKQLNYRGNLRAQILRKARDQGITDAGELARRLKDDMQFGFDPEGGAANPLALQYSRVGTFTNELEYGIGKWLQEGTQKHPLLRVIMPFVRTPVNIFRYAWERTPGLNFANRNFLDDWKAGGERRAIAQAKLEMGTALYSTAALLTVTGNINGAGPADADLRRQWRAAGNQPYSVRIPGTNKWVSYRRADPTFAPLGLVADAIQISGELHDTHRTSIAAAITASIMANMSSKAFMQGATEFMDAMSSGRGDVVENLLSSTATSFVPNILRQTNPDDTIHETRGMLDEFMARVPGFSNMLEPRRNMFGEKVLLPPGYVNRSLNPFTVMEKGDAPQDVADQLILLGRAFNMPSETLANGLINLTDKGLDDKGKQSPYDRMLEIMSKPPNGMPSLRQRLEALVQTDGYKNASVDQYVNVGGMKFRMANTIVQAYQAMAWAEVLKEYPRVQTAVRQAAELNGASLGRGSEGVEDVMQKYESLFAQPRRK
jgi:hypothetical protein